MASNISIHNISSNTNLEDPPRHSLTIDHLNGSVLEPTYPLFKAKTSESARISNLVISATCEKSLLVENKNTHFPISSIGLKECGNIYEILTILVL